MRAHDRFPSRRQVLTAAGAAVGAAALGASPGLSKATPDREFTGSWFATITVTSLPLPAPANSFASVMSFHPGGVFTESRRYYVPPLQETTGHGAWKQTGDRAEVYFRFIVQQAPPSAGAPVGTDNVRLHLALNGDGETLSGTFESEIRDTAGAVIQSFSGTVSAERIRV